MRRRAWERAGSGAVVAAVVVFALAPFAWEVISGFLPEVAILTAPPDWFKFGMILDNYRYIVTGEVPRAYQVGGVLRRRISQSVRAVPMCGFRRPAELLRTLAINS